MFDEAGLDRDLLGSLFDDPRIPDGRAPDGAARGRYQHLTAVGGLRVMLTAEPGPADPSGSRAPDPPASRDDFDWLAWLAGQARLAPSGPEGPALETFLSLAVPGAGAVPGALRRLTRATVAVHRIADRRAASPLWEGPVLAGAAVSPLHNDGSRLAVRLHVPVPLVPVLCPALATAALEGER